MQVGTGKTSGSHAEWYAQLNDIGREGGHFERLGDRHCALFVKQAPVLLVTFESAETIRTGRLDRLPLATTLADEAGWSHLSVIAEGSTWFRDPAVYAYFDRLVDTGFFDDFARVVFYGAGMGGYGAAAYSVAAPGATVLAVSPVATLDPRVTEWDGRFADQRRICFTDRYGYAPDMLDAAAQAYVLYDPAYVPDAMHAALFTKPHVTKLRCRHLGSMIEADLMDMGVLTELIDAACEGQMSAQVFHRLYRARRTHIPYLRRLLSVLEQSDRPFLTACLCRNVVQRMKAPRFRKKLGVLEQALAHKGRTMPWSKDVAAQP